MGTGQLLQCQSMDRGGNSGWEDGLDASRVHLRLQHKCTQNQQPSHLLSSRTCSGLGAGTEEETVTEAGSWQVGGTEASAGVGEGALKKPLHFKDQIPLCSVLFKEQKMLNKDALCKKASLPTES